MSYYFNNFPTIEYEYTPGILKKSIDILRRADVTSKLLDSNQYDTIIVSDGQTPQSLAINVYDDVSLYWSFFITNRLINPFYDWPLSYHKLDTRIDSMYSGVSLYLTEDSAGNTMNTQSSNSSYSIKDTIKIYETNGDALLTATIEDYDRTSGYVRLSSAENLIDLTVSGWYVTDSVGSKKMYVGRKFDQARYALHHFRDDSLSSIVSAIDVHKSPLTFISGSSGARYIDTYINTNAADSSIPATIITNEQYQSELNDRKRTMRVYSKNVISEIESSIKRLINTNE